MQTMNAVMPHEITYEDAVRRVARLLMEREGIKRSQIAAKLKISGPAVSAKFSGHAPVNYAFIVAVCEAAGVTVVQFDLWRRAVMQDSDLMVLPDLPDFDDEGE